MEDPYIMPSVIIANHSSRSLVPVEYAFTGPLYPDHCLLETELLLSFPSEEDIVR